MFAPAAHISVLIRDGGPEKPSILAIPKSLVRDGMFIETLLHSWDVFFLEGPRFFSQVPEMEGGQSTLNSIVDSTIFPIQIRQINCIRDFV